MKERCRRSAGMQLQVQVRFHPSMLGSGGPSLMCVHNLMGLLAQPRVLHPALVIALHCMLPGKERVRLHGPQAIRKQREVQSLKCACTAVLEACVHHGSCVVIHVHLAQVVHAGGLLLSACLSTVPKNLRPHTPPLCTIACDASPVFKTTKRFSAAKVSAAQSGKPTACLSLYFGAMAEGICGPPLLCACSLAPVTGPLQGKTLSPYQQGDCLSHINALTWCWLLKAMHPWQIW